MMKDIRLRRLILKIFHLDDTVYHMGGDAFRVV